MKRYFSVSVPWVPIKYRTQWHPDTAVGPFSVLSRGAFPTMDEAVEWGRTHLEGAPYTIAEINVPSYRVTARHVDTCLSSYLQDGHNRDGECLVGIYPRGQSIGEAADEVCDEFDHNDNGETEMPHEGIRAAALEALEGVDLRYINGNGGRWDNDPENTSCISCDNDCDKGDAECSSCNDGDHAQAWILLSWEAVEDAWETMVSKARALPVDELKNHAFVSLRNRHSCRECFTCACAYVLSERTA